MSKKDGRYFSLINVKDVTMTRFNFFLSTCVCLFLINQVSAATVRGQDEESPQMPSTSAPAERGYLLDVHFSEVGEVKASDVQVRVTENEPATLTIGSVDTGHSMRYTFLVVRPEPNDLPFGLPVNAAVVRVSVTAEKISGESKKVVHDATMFVSLNESAVLSITSSDQTTRTVGFNVAKSLSARDWVKAYPSSAALGKLCSADGQKKSQCCASGSCGGTSFIICGGCATVQCTGGSVQFCAYCT